MWYKTALTTIDPTGQINFPDMGGHKFNLDDLKFNVKDKNYASTRGVTIFAYIPAKKNPIGELTFTFDRNTNAIDIEGVLVTKIGKIPLEKLQQQHNDQVQLKTTGIGIGKKLYEKFLEVVQNDEEFSKADYIRGLVHSQQAYRAKNNAFGRPFEATSKFSIPEERQELQDKIFELNDELNDPDITFDTKRQILQLINALTYEMEKSKPVSHEESMGILVPASWSKDGAYSDHLFDFPSVETKHRIPPKSEEQPKRKPYQDPRQLNLDVTASKKNYKIAITQVDPTGQINMDFPGIRPKPFDIDKDVDFKIKYDEYWQSYRISAYLKNGRDLGHISIEVPEGMDTAKIEFVTLNEYPISKGTEEWEKPRNPEDRIRPDVMNELKQAGYDVDESSYTRLKWGIGKRLYEEAKKFLQKNKPNVKFVEGTVHSRDAYNSRNSVFGLPNSAYDPDGSTWYRIHQDHSPEEREELSKKISYELFPARFQNSGESEIPPSMFSVKHKLDRLPAKKDKQDQSGGLFDDVV
jgi:hypothetical protein